MKRCLPALLLLAILVGCGGKKPAGDGWVVNEPTKRVGETRKTTKYQGPGAAPDVIAKVVKPPPDLPPLKNLKIAVPAGWATVFQDLKNEWTIDKRELKKVYRISVARSPTPTEPATLNEYVKWLKDQSDEAGFVWPQIEQTVNLPDGFIIVGRPRLATDVTNTRLLVVGFVVVRTIGGDRFRFKCHDIPEEDRQQALDICKGAKF